MPTSIAAPPERRNLPFDPRCVTPEDPTPLHAPHPRRRSRYRHVYYKGRDRWMVLIRFRGALVNLGCRPTERDAARHAAGCLRLIYGPDWPARREAAVSAVRSRVSGWRR